MINNPFDHSECDHPDPIWPVQVTESFGFNLLDLLAQLWALIASGNQAGALAAVESVGFVLTQVAIGNGDIVEDGYRRFEDLMDMRKSAHDFLNDPSKWDEEIRKLLGDA